KWSRWRAPGAIAEGPADGHFAIHTGNLSLLELLPDPQLDNYVVRAEVRQERGLTGDVGIYFCYSMHKVALGDAHCFSSVSFADWGNEGRDAKGKWIAAVRMKLFYYCQPQIGEGFRYFMPLQVAKDIDPLEKTGAKPEWRQLSVVFKDGDITVLWERNRAIIGTLSSSDRLQFAKSMLIRRPNMAGASPEFPVRGALGLYIYKSAASFRNVVVEPL